MCLFVRRDLRPLVLNKIQCRYSEVSVCIIYYYGTFLKIGSLSEEKRNKFSISKNKAKKNMAQWSNLYSSMLKVPGWILPRLNFFSSYFFPCIFLSTFFLSTFFLSTFFLSTFLLSTFFLSTFFLSTFFIFFFYSLPSLFFFCSNFLLFI